MPYLTSADLLRMREPLSIVCRRRTAPYTGHTYELCVLDNGSVYEEQTESGARGRIRRTRTYLSPEAFFRAEEAGKLQWREWE